MGNFFANLNARLRELMMGRNGGDTLTSWVIGAALVITLINIFIPNVVCSMLSWALLFYACFRMFSKDVPARRAENEKFVQLINKPKAALKRQQTSKTTLYFKCEQCGQQLSVPRGKGTLKITCPKCKHQTKIKS